MTVLLVYVYTILFIVGLGGTVSTYYQFAGGQCAVLRWQQLRASRVYRSS